MNKYIVAFIVLAVMLFGGIGILMKPTAIAPSSSSSATGADQVAENNPALKVVITVGSVSLIIGLVGLAVLGFMVAREDKPEQEQNRT
jgi:Flp pilus assembly protein CpaB